MKFTSCVISIIVMCVLFMSSGIGNSQERDTASAGDADNEPNQTTLIQDAEIHEVVETLREAYLLQELELSDEKSQALLENIRHTEEAKKIYLARRYAIENELHDLLAFPNPVQNQIANALQLLETAQLQYHQQLIQMNEELQEILTLEEQAKYVLFQRTFNRRLKQLITRIRQQNSEFTVPENQLLRRKDTESVIRQSD